MLTILLYSCKGDGRPQSERNNLLISDIGNYTCQAVSNETATQDSKTSEILILCKFKILNIRSSICLNNETK